MEGLRPLFRYFELSGRSGRAEYWKFFVYVFVVELLAAFLEMGADIEVPVFTSAVWVVTTIPQFTATVRRLHDTDRSGWVMVWPAIAITTACLIVGFAQQASEYGEPTSPALALFALGLLVGGAGYLLYLMIKAGDEHENRFGEPDNFVPSSLAALRGKRPEQEVVETGPPHPTGGGAHMADALAQIERLGDLRDKGLLSDEEFASQKSAVLARI